MVRPWVVKGEWVKSPSTSWGGLNVGSVGGGSEKRRRRTSMKRRAWLELVECWPRR